MFFVHPAQFHLDLWIFHLLPFFKEIFPKSGFANILPSSLQHLYEYIPFVFLWCHLVSFQEGGKVNVPVVLAILNPNSLKLFCPDCWYSPETPDPFHFPPCDWLHFFHVMSLSCFLQYMLLNILISFMFIFNHFSTLSWSHWLIILSAKTLAISDIICPRPCPWQTFLQI